MPDTPELPPDCHNGHSERRRTPRSFVVGTHDRKVWPHESSDGKKRRVQGLCNACSSTIILLSDLDSDLIIATLYRERAASYDEQATTSAYLVEVNLEAQKRCSTLADDFLANAAVLEQTL